jgi:CheY-like chemotaxis protein
MGGEVQVTAENLRLAEEDVATLKKGDYVLVSVKDQGIGISEEMLSRIFDPFFTTKTQGHGLGLAISHSIITRHGGAIVVQSELGKGTTFDVYLPAIGEAGIENLKPTVIGHSGTGKILLMDDEEALRSLMSYMLESFGYSVIGKSNAKDTLDFFVQAKENGEDFAAVILDLTVPGGKGGKEVAQEIRKIDEEIPLFVSTGYAGDPILANPEEYGFTAGISKPFKMADLMEMLGKHIKKTK